MTFNNRVDMDNLEKKIDAHFIKRRDEVWSKGEYCKSNWIEKFESRKKIYDFAIDKDSICVEVGVSLGENACMLYHTGCKELHLVDPWSQEWPQPPNHLRNNKFYDIVSKVFKDAKNIKIHRQKSSDACDKFQDESIDFIYIDAGHSYKDVKNDLKVWRKKVKIGGYISGDDYRQSLKKTHNKAHNRTFGVIRAVDEFIDLGFGEIIYFDDKKTFPLPGEGQFCLMRLK